MTKTPIKWELLLPIVLATVLTWLCVQAQQKPIGDFGNYYYAASFLVKGNWGTWVYEPIAFNQAIYDLGERNFFLNYTPVPPLTTLIYIPFTLLGVGTAKLVWNVLNSVLFLVSLYRLKSISTIDWKWILLFVTVLFIPLRSTIYEGQSYLLLTFLIGEGLYQYTKGNFWIMAICWALAIHLKITPAILLFFLLFEKQWKPMVYLLLVTGSLFLCSLPFLGTDVWLHYLTTILPRLMSGEINNTYATNYQSAQVLFKQLFYEDKLHNPSVILHSPYMYSLCWNMFKYILFALAVCVSIWGSKSTLQRFSVWLTVSFLISGYGNSFSLLLLLIPATFMIVDISKQRQVTVLVPLLIIGWISYHYFLSWPTVFHFPRLFALLFFFGLMLDWKYVKQLISVIAFAIIFALVSTRIPERISSANLLNKEIALLCYDYELIAPNQMRVFYFDNKGPQSSVVKLPFEIKHVAFPEYSAQQLMAKERIKKVSVVNNTQEIYLSDYNRGVGFYTLRIRPVLP